jgi:nucleotide-binding universal stress UspA family protein
MSGKNTMTIQHILLSLDRTQMTDPVFEEGVIAAKKYDAALTLVHCIADTVAWAMTANVPPAGVGLSWPTAVFPATPSIGEDPNFGSAIDERIAQQTQIVQKWLQEYQKRATQAGCSNVSYEVSVGDPSDCICALARKLDADLIVVGRKDRSGLEELVLGSVSNSVVHHAPCSVLVVQS